MVDLLATQLDYLYFVSGLALVLLGSIALSIPRDAPGRLPWEWLAAFALVHGAVEWLEVAALALGRHPALDRATAFLTFASFVLLAEFARRAHAVVRSGGPGRWLTGTLAAVPLLAALVAGLPALLPATCVFLALPAGLWAAAVVGAASRPAPGKGDETGSPLRWVASCLALYALATGVVVPAGPAVPRGWPTAEAFLLVTGIPTPFLQGLAAAGAALGLWAHAISLDSHGRVARKRWRFFWGTAALLALVIAGGWQATDRFGRQHDQDLVAEAEAFTAQVQAHLFMEMQEASDAVRTARRMVEALGLAAGIARGGSPELDAVVDAVVGGDDGRVAFLLDTNGRVVATSGTGRPAGLTGPTADGRPIVREALQGVDGRSFGTGMATGKPGFRASSPVRDPEGKVAGVVVVERTLDGRSFGPPGNASAFLVGPDGKVLVAAAESGASRPMWPGARTPEGAPEAGSPLLEAPWTGSTWTRVDGVRHVAVRSPLPALDWSVVTLRKEALRGTSRLLGILLALLLSSAIVASFVILQRQLGAESSLARKKREAEGRAREMARKADTDALTGITNRQGFNDAIAREFARGRRFRHPLSIVLVDLDHFKRVNDRFGHSVGDQVLVAVARLLSTRVRESDLVARWGGEEFAVIASTTDGAGAARLAEKLRGLLEVTSVGPPGAITASFGVAEMRPDDTPETLLRRADGALYAAKEAGRNQVRCAESWVDMAVIAAAEATGGGEGRAVYTETGHPAIDEENRELSESLAAFVAIVEAGDEAATRGAMPGLVEAVSAHFAREEALMRRRAYPARSRHEEAHMLLVADAKRFHADLERNGLTPGFRQWAATRLPEWFRYHILAHDVALGRFLGGRGAVTAEARSPQGAA